MIFSIVTVVRTWQYSHKRMCRVMLLLQLPYLWTGRWTGTTTSTRFVIVHADSVEQAFNVLASIYNSQSASITAMYFIVVAVSRAHWATLMCLMLGVQLTNCFQQFDNCVNLCRFCNVKPIFLHANKEIKHTYKYTDYTSKL